MERIRAITVGGNYISFVWWFSLVFLCATLGHLLQIPLIEANTVSQETNNSAAEANLPYLFAAFVIIWVLFFGYLLFVLRRGRDLRREVEELRHELLKRDD